MMAHNLSRELQMRASERTHDRSPLNRATLWTFEKLDTLRLRLIQRAGRLTRPHGALTLTMSANSAAREDVERYVDALAA
jgi:hypothetical protein